MAASKQGGYEMKTDLLFRQIMDLKRSLNTLEVSIAEINNAIFLLEERMFDLDDNKNIHDCDALEYYYASNWF